MRKMLMVIPPLAIKAVCAAAAIAFFAPSPSPSMAQVQPAHSLPSRSLTPGYVNPQVTQANISKTVCAVVYQKPERPDEAATNSMKRMQLAVLGPGQNPALFEENYLIPPSLGGHVRDNRNLWPQPINAEWGPARKDRLDRRLHRLVCEHSLPLEQAQREIAKDWIAAFGKYCGRAEDCPALETGK
jgi:hypothetical protein